MLESRIQNLFLTIHLSDKPDPEHKKTGSADSKQNEKTLYSWKWWKRANMEFKAPAYHQMYRYSLLKINSLDPYPCQDPPKNARSASEKKRMHIQNIAFISTTYQIVDKNKNFTFLWIRSKKISSSEYICTVGTVRYIGRSKDHKGS